MTPNAAPTEALPPLPAPSFYVNVSKESPRTPAFDAEQMNDRWRAGFEAGRTILAGDAAADGVWVPREPTNEMYLAACAAYTDWHNRCLYPESYEEPLTKTSWTHIDVYLSMIAAAPQPTRVDKGEQDRGTQMTTLTPTPTQAVVLEALRIAEEAKREARHLFDLAPDAEDMAHLSMAIDRLAALVQPPEAPAAVEVSRLAEDERAELERLRALVNSPETKDFLSGVRNEVAHQIERWGTVHDRAKEPADWFWLVGYLAGKALASHVKGDTDKALHHCISTSAALANWHAHILHGAGLMQPGSSDLQDFLRETFGANFIEYQERKQ